MWMLDSRTMRRWVILSMVGIACLNGCIGVELTRLDYERNTLGEIPKKSPPFMLNTGGAPQVYNILGLNDEYSRGLIDLTDKMIAAGMHATWINDTAWQGLGLEIQQAYENGTLSGDLVFVGHSFGADDCVKLARQLNEKSIPVKLLVLIDSTFAPPIPPNVDRCLHLYIPTLFGDLFPNTFAGNPVKAETGNTHTQVVNRLIDYVNFGAAGLETDHFSVDSSAVIHEAVIEEVRAYAGAR
ncbi:MAG: hypothetical protein AMXMBFR13_27600 [Phycisphaerae bacterium]